MNKYSIHINWSDEDESYVATVSEFPTLMVFGDSKEEAIKEAKIVLLEFINVYKEDGMKLPKPIKVF